MLAHTHTHMEQGKRGVSGRCAYLCKLSASVRVCVCVCVSMYFQCATTHLTFKWSPFIMSVYYFGNFASQFTSVSRNFSTCYLASILNSKRRWRRPLKTVCYPKEGIPTRTMDFSSRRSSSCCIHKHKS